MIKKITNARIVTNGKILENIDILIENGVISNLVEKGRIKCETVDLKGAYIAPGFIDIHCHGGAGYEFLDGTQEAVVESSQLHSRHGVRVLYPTLSAMDFATTYKALEAIEKAKAKCPLIIPGVHLEGPYLSPAMCGAQDTKHITPPKREEYEALVSRFGKLIKRWTYAPEGDNGDFLNFLNKNGIIASAGHTAAEYSDMLAAFKNGCRLVTHLYSCTSTITRHSGFRHLGVVESAYLLDGLFVEAIADGKHLPPELLKMIVKIKGDSQTCLITDAIRPAGVEAQPNVNYGTQSVPYIVEDGVAKLADRSAFAGSIATADILLKTAVTAGIPLESAVKMLTQTPATAMGLEGLGQIAANYKAVFTVFDDNLNIVNVSI